MSEVHGKSERLFPRLNLALKRTHGFEHPVLVSVYVARWRDCTCCLYTYSVAAKDQILGWTPAGGRTSGIIHQMKAKNLRIQKLHDAGTKKLHDWRYRTVSMGTFLKW